MGGPHPSHKTRISDASTFDEICTLCGATDELGSWGTLVYPCPKAKQLMLTREEKIAIIDYVSGYSIKAILEDVEEINYTEEKDKEIREAIREFLDSIFYNAKKQI